jgi:hypothetical protein
LKTHKPAKEVVPPSPQGELLARACEQALKSGRALPDVFAAADLALIPKLIQPQWISAVALRNLEQMGLGEKAVLRILDLLLNGVIPFPDPPPSSGPVAAAFELSFPTQPATAEDMAGKIPCLYEQNPRFLKLRALAWLDLLDRWATAKLAQELPQPDRLLAKHSMAQHIIIAGLGMPLLKTIEAILPFALPGWNLRSIEFGLTPEQTLNDTPYTGWIPDNSNATLEKVDVIDALIYGRQLSFADMIRLVGREMEAALLRAASVLDPTKPLVISGDRGFRLAPDGQSFSHDGNSTLERITPLLLLHRSD